MFFGRYDYTIDAKGRLNFPAKFREAMGESFVVLEWVDNCLFALPMQEVEKLADKLDADELMDSWAVSGDLFSTACEVVPDKQGRILLPAELRAYAGLEKDVTIIGPACGAPADAASLIPQNLQTRERRPCQWPLNNSSLLTRPRLSISRFC